MTTPKAKIDYSLYSSAWLSGYAAREENLPRSRCGYHMNTNKRDAWEAGWDKAQRDADAGEDAVWTDDPLDENYHPDLDFATIDLNDFAIEELQTRQALRCVDYLHTGLHPNDHLKVRCQHCHATLFDAPFKTATKPVERQVRDCYDRHCEANHPDEHANLHNAAYLLRQHADYAENL